jgi:transposase InsO family protein
MAISSANDCDIETFGFVDGGWMASPRRSSTPSRWRAGRGRQRALQVGADPRTGTGPRRTVDDVELATLAWVHWWNTARLHGYLGDTAPAEFEAAYAAQQADQLLVGIQ